MQRVYRIVDEARICHVGFVHKGSSFVIPTLCTRVAGALYIHGAPASRMLKTLCGGVQACVTFSLIDGLVFAKSAFHHSMNYRSAMVFGSLALVEDPCKKLAALRSFVEDLAEGRAQDCRLPNAKELAATTVLSLPIEEFSCKERSGPPVDDQEDLALPHWSGVVPVGERAFAPEPAQESAPVPGYLQTLCSE